MATPNNRDYSSPPDTFHSMAANYAWNPYGSVTGKNGLTTGVWSSLETSQDGALRVSLTSGINIDSLNISGLVVNTDQLEVINTSGTQYLAAISGNTLKVIDSPSGYATGTFHLIGGRAVNTSTFLPGYISGGNVAANFDKDNGGLLVNQGNLTRSVDSVTTWLSGSNTILESSAGILGGSGFFSGLLFSGNASRQEMFIQCTSTVTPAYVRFGAIASKQNYTFILNPAGTSGYGGGSVSNERYRGAVYFSGGAVNGYEI